MADLKDPAVCFREEEKAIRAIEKKEFAHKTMPDHEAMQEGRRVEALLHKYGEKIREESDIDSVLLDSIPGRVGAYAHCVAENESLVELDKNSRERYHELKKEGYAIRAESIERLEYVFRGDEDVLEAVDRIKEGRGDLEMIKDSYSFYALLCKHKERAVAAKYPWELAERQNEVYKELCSLTAQIDISPEKLKESEILCKQAWTHLWNALVEFYEAGRFTFYHEPDIKELFYVDYMQRIGKMRDVKQADEPETAIAG